MSQMNLAILLSKLGWGSGFRLPVANDENRELEKQLEKEQKYCLELRAQIGEEGKIKDNLRQHLGRVTTELGISRKLLESKQSTVETEGNLLALDERTERNIAKDLKVTAKNCLEIQQRNEATTRNLETRREKVVRDHYRTFGDNPTSLAIKKALEQKEQDISYILKLTSIDEQLVKDFELKFQKYGEELAHMRIELDNTVKYTSTLGSQYERACVQYQRAHKERIQALDLWTKSLESLKKRDEEIKAMGQEYAHVRGLCQRSDAIIERRQEVLAVRQSHTENIENKTFVMDRKLASLREEIPKIIEFRHRLAEEITDQRTTISNTTDTIKQVKVELTDLEKVMDSMDYRMRVAEAELKEAEARAKIHDSGVQTVETRMKEFEQMVFEEERKEDLYMKQLEKNRKFYFQKSNEALTLNRKLDDIEFEMKSGNVMYKNLRERAKVDYLELQKKRHVGYELELRVVEAETHYNELAYPKIPESSTSVYYTSDTLAHCREELKEVLKDKVLVMNQKSHLEDIVRRVSKEIDVDLRGKVQLGQNLTETSIKKNRVEKQLEKSKKTLRHFEVEEVLIKLEFRKFIIAHKEQKTKILSLEQQRLYLQMAASERRAEIDEHKSFLRTKLHIVKDERTRRNFQKNEVFMEVERRKKKYEILMATLASQDEREKEDFSEAFYILKNAQERETVKREGDIWDAKVKEAEKEVVALQNTLALMVGSNKAFKDSLTPIPNTTEEGQKIQQLEQAQRQAVIRKRKAEKLQRELAKDCAAKESEIFNLTQTIEMLASMAEDKKYELNAVMVEIANQNAKIDRANKVAAKLARDLRCSNDDDKKLIEAELQLKCTREKFSFALKTLDRALSLQPNMRSTVADYFKQNPLLIDVAKKLSLHGKCTDSASSSGTASPHSSHDPRKLRKGVSRKSQEKFIGTIYERASQFSIGQSRSPTLSGSTRNSPVGSLHDVGSRLISPISVGQLEDQLQELRNEAEMSG